MSRITRIVPTTIATAAAALALAAPAAQAKPFIGQSGGSGFVSPSVQSTQDFKAYGDSGFVSPSVQSTQDFKAAYDSQAALSAGRLHARPFGAAPQAPVAAVTVPESSGSGIDWTAAAIGSGLVSILLIAAGFGYRRRGQLAV